jgi:hypothetical protein
MSRLVLASILLLLIAAPLLAARDPNPIRAMRRLLLYVLVVHLAYAFAVVVIYPRV